MSMIVRLSIVAWMLARFAAVHASPPSTHRHALPLGQTTIVVREETWGTAPRLICHMHDDETTAEEAASTVLEEVGGRLVSVQNDSHRNVSFRIGAEERSIDPNRIFTPNGVSTFLRPPTALEHPASRAVASFARSLRDIYRVGDVRGVIAVHNNTPGDYSVRSYQAGGNLARDAAEVHFAPDQDPDDFCFVTDPNWFTALASRRLHCVLQANDRVTDDGSLSVWCATLGIPYINVEAELGHREQQVAMIRAAIDVVDQVAPDAQSSPGDLVDLAEVDRTWIIDARYARSDNFLKQAVYPSPRLYLRQPVAERLKRVQEALRAQGLGLKIWDAYRPLSVQRQMWAILPDSRYVADPAVGSRHNRGAAIDVTLVDGEGQELRMPTPFDEFSPRAHLDCEDLPEEAKANRAKLRSAMESEGFQPLATEWWHFDAPDWRDYSLMEHDPY